MKQATELVEYGIQSEKSDIRAHVCAKDKTVYVFPTANGLEAIRRYAPLLRPATQPGVDGITALGWLVKKEWIMDLRIIRFHWRWWGHFKPNFSSSRKGKFAVACVRESMRRGYFPIWFDGIEEENLDVQIAGTDILIFAHKRVQVKCDYPISDTGNLFLQKAECNPLNYF